MKGDRIYDKKQKRNNINSISCNNGVFSRAKEAKIKNEEAKAREKLEIELTNLITEKMWIVNIMKENI